MAKDNRKKNPGSILGDITPNPGTTDHMPGRSGRHETTHHSGADDVIGGGGAGTVRGTRNYPRRAGVTGGDIGNRPE